MNDVYEEFRERRRRSDGKGFLIFFALAILGMGAVFAVAASLIAPAATWWAGGVGIAVGIAAFLHFSR